MKLVKLLVVCGLFLATSCVSVKVASDYDSSTNFNEYKTYAFYKKGIDKADLSDLDKRRVLKAIEQELAAKGFTKSENPDILVNIFTKSANKVRVNNNNFGWGAWGLWSPWYWGAGWGWGAWGPWGFGADDYQVTHTIQGTLFIDLIDANKRELAWQGVGTSNLRAVEDTAKKEARIKTIVSEIMANYPPNAE
ncbi:MAG: DUF4136 domain-containing protein [Flavobacteriaceae bacterium]|nr:DUF4136 domain-containing protein [Flavobacteriaceae bacterium]